jgi:hypothetical protein
MKKKSFINNEFVIMDLFSSIWENKSICIFFALTFGLIFYFLTPQTKIIESQSISIIRKPPKLIFSNFINRYDTFFSSLYSQPENTDDELDQFYQAFKLNITSVDNFIIYLNEKNYSKIVFDGLINDKKEQQRVLQNKFGFLKKNELKDKTLKSQNTEGVFFIHKPSVDGPTILNNYIKFCYDQTLQYYIEKKKEQFMIILDKYKSAEEIAIKIGVKDPFHLDPDIDFKNQQLSSFFNTSRLYFRGYEILGLEINELKKILNAFENNNETLRYNPIVDSAFIRSEKDNPKGIVPNYIRGILLGLLLSFVIIFFKSLVLNSQKPVKN